MKRTNKGIFVACLLVAVWALIPSTGLIGAAEGSVPSVEQDTNDAIAVVGESKIGLEELEGYLSYRPSLPGEELQQRLEEMVSAEALYQEALRQGIDRDPRIRTSIQQILIQRLLDEEVNKTLWKKKLSEEELKEWYEAHKAEYNRPEQVRVAGIFIAAPDVPKAEGRAEKRLKAEEILTKALALQDSRFGFGELVHEFSDKHEMFPNGSTDFFSIDGSPAGIDEGLAKAAFSIGTVGKIADTVVETPEGFHVVMLIGRRAAVKRHFNEVKTEVEGRLRNEMLREARQEFIQSVREKTKVSIDTNALETLSLKLKEDKPRPIPSGVTPPMPEVRQ